MAVVIHLNNIDIPAALHAAAAAIPELHREETCSARVWAVASTALQYLALIALATASGVLWSAGGWGFATLILGSAGFIVHQVLSSFRDLRAIVSGELPPQEIAARVHKLIHRLFFTAMVLGAVVLGIGGASLGYGITTLMEGFSGGSAWEILLGAYYATGALGYLLPFALATLKIAGAASHLYDRAANYLLAVISGEQEFNLQALAAPIILHLRNQHQGAVPLNDLAAVAGLLPDDAVREHLRLLLPTLQPEELIQAAASFRTLCTVEFLADCLPEDRFRPLMDHLLEHLSQDEAAALGQSLDALPAQLDGWEARYADEVQRDALRGDLEESLAQFQRNLNHVLSLLIQIDRLGAAALPHQDRYADLQQRLDAARALRPPCVDLRTRYLDMTEGAVRPRLLSLASRLAPRDQEDDLAEPSYETLGAYGFRIVDFRRLGEALHLDMGDDVIQTVYQELERRGLGTRGQLAANGILATGSDQAIFDRIVEWCQNAQPVAVEPQNLADYRIGSWERVARAVNTVFHHTLSATLMAVQIASQPISTAAGVVYQFVYSRNWNLLRFVHLWETSPNYVSASFRERCRAIYQRLAPMVSALWLGPLGGFFMGMDYAQAVRTRFPSLDRRLIAAFGE